MKYIFITHSHTLCLSDLGTINYLNLPLSDCLFVLDRNFNCDYFPLECTIVDGNAFCEDCKEAYFEQNHKNRKRKIKAIDQQISSWTQDKYELFLPHMCNPYAMLMATHHDCQKVSFVQESAFSVKKRFTTNLSSFEKIKLRIRTYRIYHTSRFYGTNWYVDGQLSQRNIDTYGLYPEFFQYLPSSFHTVKWPTIDNSLEIDESGVYFIMDGFTKNGMAESDVYLEQCSDMIRQFHGSNNYVKFHPNQSQEERDTICSFFDAVKANVTIMDQSIPFEIYISNGRNLNIVGMTSSLLFLAKRQGHNVISCDSWMMKSPRFRKLHEEGMPLFHEYFEDVLPVIKQL